MFIELSKKPQRGLGARVCPYGWLEWVQRGSCLAAEIFHDDVAAGECFVEEKLVNGQPARTKYANKLTLS